jgi:isopentenyl diphosphate isomerase/L-lactate dehydrogenase-like FMN-dependent dehydrogenase
VAGKVPVLIDGSFRRGSDVVKALALGAQAMMLGRLYDVGLAAYGAEGVQSVLEVLQTEVARTMVNISKPTIKMLDGSVVKVHGRS